MLDGWIVQMYLWVPAFETVLPGSTDPDGRSAGCYSYLLPGATHGGYLQTVGSALKTPQVARSVRRRVGSAAALAESLLERRGPALDRRLTPRERRVELTAAAAFTV